MSYQAYAILPGPYDRLTFGPQKIIVSNVFICEMTSDIAKFIIEISMDIYQVLWSIGFRTLEHFRAWNHQAPEMI